jgi:ribose transport system ATP-binding protein
MGPGAALEGLPTPSPAPTGSTAEALLEVRGLSKRFPGCRALDGFTLEVERGEVMALVGQNGCGKSTFIKVLSGYHQPDPGAEVLWEGQDVRLGEPTLAHRLGIHFVHQDLGLLDDLSAAENLAVGVGFTTSRTGLIRWREQRRRTAEALASLGYTFDVTTPVGRLGPSQRVGVAIARAMVRKAGADRLALLVLDEPTAAMPQSEVDTLFAVVRRLRDAGTSTLFVSHRLDEVFAVADRVTVVRDGRAVAVRTTTSLDQRELVELILGRPPEPAHDGDVVPTPGRSSPTRAAPGLSVRGLGGRHLRDLDLDLHAGEVLGVTGLTGSGREELAALLFGGRPRRAGTVEVDGRPIDRLTPAVAKRLGMALVPGDRRVAAVLPDANVRENLTLADLVPLRRRGLIRRRVERTEVASWLDRMQVRPRDGEAPILALSGGNQQKVLLARWLRRQPRILLLDEPTQGVDVGTKPEIYALLRRAAAGGTGVLVCSTDSEELVEVADRVVVLARGTVAAELRGPALTLDRLNHDIVAA